MFERGLCTGLCLVVPDFYRLIICSREQVRFVACGFLDLISFNKYIYIQSYLQDNSQGNSHPSRGPPEKSGAAEPLTPTPLVLRCNKLYKTYIYIIVDLYGSVQGCRCKGIGVLGIKFTHHHVVCVTLKC